MIKNDEQYNKIFKEYLNSKGIDTKNQKYCSCEDLGCDNCILKDVKNDSDFCARYPFKEIKNHEKQISLLKKDIAIMAKWKKERKIEKNLKEICETFRTLIGNYNIDFTCYGISCDKCLFHNMDNFREWARKTKEESLGEDVKLADFANAAKELKAIEESNAILDYNLLKDLKLVNAEYSMVKVDSRGYSYTNNKTMLCYIFKKLFHRELSDMTKFHWDPSWIYDEYSGPRSMSQINKICKQAQEKYLNIEVLKDAFRSLFFHEMEDNILFAYCNSTVYYYTAWLDLKYKKQKRSRKMINKKSKKVMYHNFLDDLDVLKATYADVSDDIKRLLDRTSEQANVELRKEEKKNG